MFVARTQRQLVTLHCILQFPKETKVLLKYCCQVHHKGIQLIPKITSVLKIIMARLQFILLQRGTIMSES